MKKKILLLAVVAICVALTAAAGTMAYFTAETTAHNVITTHGVDITLHEHQRTDAGLVEYPTGTEVKVMPGMSVSKIVTMENHEADAYIRARFDVTIKDENKAEMQLSRDEIARLVQIAVDENCWTRKAGDNDWWYYTAAVGKETTQPLFTQVVFSGPNMTNEYQNCTITIDVVAQAVQAANNGSSAVDADGWSA